jgi:saccharopine dehydrogenase-like NADP-dependent oxidoreductase
MKTVLVLGAGSVARPLVHYLLKQGDLRVEVASRTLTKAQELVAGFENGAATALLVDHADALQAAVQRSDVVISLLPWVHHLAVARLCLDLGRHLVTTSYVKPEMQALDAEVSDKGLLFLNEIGVDPGIDHMAAMQIIDRVKRQGGQIDSFYSYCGGLPSLASNTNPFGYKFSWSPTGMLLAAGNDGCYLKDGQVVTIAGPELFTHYWLLDVPGAGVFEAHVNRDALPYREIYGIPDVNSMYRGTLRNVGHCESWHCFKRLGLLDQERGFDLDRLSPRAVLADLIGSNGEALEADLAAYLQVPLHSVTLKKMQWLGLLEDRCPGLGRGSAFDLFAHLLQQKLVYTGQEVDLLVQQHEFTVRHADGRRERIVSTLVDTGIPGGDSSMSRTVGLPAAIATRLLLEGRLPLTGVRIPVVPEIYEPVLSLLAKENITLTETATVIEG